MRLLAPCILLVGALFASAPALALSPEAARAEHIRLKEEMKKLARRNAWRGVDSQYRSMLSLEKDGVVLGYRDHYTGAQAARELGRITEVYTRLKRAVEQRPEEEATTWLGEIEANYGLVLLASDARYKGETSLAPAAMPFDPAKRAAIGAAQATLAEFGRFEGLLPHGDYTYGGKPFGLAAQGDKVEVLLVPEGGSSKRVARGERRNGLRVAVGGGLASIASTYSTGGTEGIQPTEGRSGVLLRGSLGYSQQLGDSVAGLFFEAGYHGMTPETVEGNTALSVTADAFSAVTGEGTSALNLGFVQAGPTLWLGNQLELSLGVGWSLGTVSLVSPVDCVGSGCSGVQTGVTDVVTGQTRMPGAMLGTQWVPQPLTFGMLRNTYGLGLGLQGGLWRDDARSYPWAQASLTLVPSLTSR